MVDATSYPPLESLLLFTWIRKEGLEGFTAGAFQRASQDLINHRVVKEDDAYDPSRLTPALLEQLFLQLLNEDLKTDFTEPSPADPPLSPNSKKRKRAGPPVRVNSLDEAKHHIARLPNIENKLYYVYKEKFIADLWRDQQEENRLEAELRDLERQEREAAEARQNRSAEASSLKEASRPPSTAPIHDTQKPAPRTNGTGAYPLPPAAPSPVGAANNAPPPHLSPLRQPPKIPISQQAPPVSTGYFAPIAGQETQGLSTAAGAIPGRPQEGPSTENQPVRSVSATQPAPEGGLSQPGTPSQVSQSPQFSKPGSLKWEPPYQPPPGSQQQRPPNIAQFPQQRSPHSSQSWSPQAPPQYSHPPPLHGPQGHVAQQAAFAPRPIQGTYQQGGHGVPPLQPAPPRSHSGSPAPSQRPMGVPSPLPGQSRVPQAPYQHNQPVFPPPQSLPPPSRMAPHASATPPPQSPGIGSQQQWQQPPGQAQLPPAGAQHGAPPTASLPQPYQPRYPPAPRPMPPHVLGPTQQAATPGPRRPHPVLPHTPLTMPFHFRGSGTRWTAAQPTPSTPGPIVGEVQSPAFEPLSPVLQTASLASARKQSKPAGVDTSASKKGARGSRSAHHGRDGSRQTRTPSAVSPRDDQSQMDVDFSAKVKREDGTPRPLEDADDTTADESMSGRRQFASPRNPRGVGKRKRQDSMATEFRPRGPPPPPPGIPTHVLWTRAFPKVSSTCLDGVVSHKYANMFQNPIKAKEAPGYKSIILQPTCLKEIQKAITAGHKAATAAAAALPGGDPATSSVWLPISEDLIPPRAIINSVQLERELDHMFANAIMYNLDPNRGPGPAFQKGSGVGEKGANEAHGRVQSHEAGDAANMIGYKVDENSVVNETNSMFKTVSHLLMELRMSEAEPGNPPAPLPPGAVPTSERLARGSIAGSLTDGLGPAQTPGSGVGGSFAEDEAEESHADREHEGAGGASKRRRVGRA